MPVHGVAERKASEMPCKCNTVKRDPDCTLEHALNEVMVDMAFPGLDRGPSANPNPMNSRCGLEDCDCGYVIEKLVTALKRALSTTLEIERVLGNRHFNAGTLQVMTDAVNAAKEDERDERTMRISRL